MNFKQVLKELNVIIKCCRLCGRRLILGIFLKKEKVVVEWINDITGLLGINFPIVQASMFGVTTP